MIFFNDFFRWKKKLRKKLDHHISLEFCQESISDVFRTIQVLFLWFLEYLPFPLYFPYTLHIREQFQKSSDKFIEFHYIGNGLLDLPAGTGRLRSKRIMSWRYSPRSGLGDNATCIIYVTISHANWMLQCKKVLSVVFNRGQVRPNSLRESWRRGF